MLFEHRSIEPNTNTLMMLSVVIGVIAAGLLFAFDNPVIALIASLIPIGLLVIARWPEVGLAMMIFVVYTNLSSIIIHFHNGPSVLKPLIPAMFVLAVAVLILRREYLPNLIFSVPFLLAYGLVIAATLFVAREKFLTLEGLEVYLKNALIVVVMLLMIRDFKSLRLIIWTLVLSGLFLSFLSVYQQITQTFDNAYWGFAQAQIGEIVGGVNSVRIGGPLNSTNEFAMIMYVIVPLSLDRFFSEKMLPLKVVAFLAAVFSFLTVTFTFSRGGFIGLAVALLVWIISRGFNRRMLLTIILLGLLLSPFLPDQYKARISSLNEIYSAWVDNDLAQISDLSFRGRLSEQIAGWRMFRDHPLLGVGYDNYDLYYLEYSEQIGLDGRREERQAHNLYLEVLAETGVTGFIVFSIFLLVGIWHLTIAKKTLFKKGEIEQSLLAGAIVASFLGYLAGSFFLHASFPRYFWLIFGLVLVIPLVTQHTLKDLDESV